MAGQLIANERKPGRTDLMQGAKLARRVPPRLGQALEALDLGRIERALGALGAFGFCVWGHLLPGSNNEIRTLATIKRCCEEALIPL